MASKPPFKVTTARGLYDNAHACITSARASALRAQESGLEQVRIVDANGLVIKPATERGDGVSRIGRFG